MNKFWQHIILLLGVSLFVSCTSGRWIVTEEDAVERDEFIVLEEKPFLKQTGEVSPENPVLRLELLAEKTYEYPEKIRAERMVQDYQLRPTFVALGLAGAGAAFYAAHSANVFPRSNSNQKLTLNTLGSILALSGFLTMKTEGEPRPTGEERLLRSTGTYSEVDTVEASDTTDYSAEVTLLYDDEVISESEQNIEEKMLEIDLGNPLGALEIKGEDIKDVEVQVSFRDSVISRSYDISEILIPYARITSPITELRASPNEVDGNILAELVNGTQIQILNEQDEWYKVQYGISENYIIKEDTERYWRSTEFIELNPVFALQQVPFGNIDVESNIPLLGEQSEDAWGLAITNEDFGGFLSPRTYAHRDGRLIATYLENALGFQENQIFNLRDITSNDLLDSSLSEIEEEATDSSTVFIYLNGYSLIEQEGDTYQFSYLTAAESDESDWSQSVNLNELFKRIAAIPADKKIVVADLDFQNDEEIDFGNDDPLEDLADIITDEQNQSGVLFASKVGQESELYLDRSYEDKKHHIFTYYFARAIQQRNVSMATINQYLQRNVTYTSRKIYDQSQDPQFYGNIELRLID